MRLQEVDTPALLIDLDAFERNLKRMADAVPGTRPKLRPHAKTHKSPVIALRQMALGAVGVCCQKVAEAEALVHGGVPDVLVTNQIVGLPKLQRLASLARFAEIGVCVDDADNIRDLDRVAGEFGVTLRILVEINLGANRCGVEPGEPALRLAELIDQQRNLSFGGLQAYHGSAQHIRDYAARQDAIEKAGDKARRTAELLEQQGYGCPVVTGAGTGTFRFEADSGVWDELQCGSYIFMDADYARNRGEHGEEWSEFEHSLFVWSTVMSRPSEDRAVLDVGLKAVSTDSGPPVLLGHDEAEYIGASDEHGKLRLHRPSNAFRVGQKVKLIPGHCDPTVNLYDWYVGIRNNRVEALWPIAARGAVT